jgi:hypothetical protein
MIDRDASARGYFNLALAAIIVPVGAFAATVTLAFWAQQSPSRDPEHRSWTRRLYALAVVDVLVMIAMIALLAGRITLPTPQVEAPPGPRIGVVLDPIDAGHGARVIEVRPGSPADRAGIHAGDVIERVDGHPVDKNGDLNEQIATTAAGGSRAIEVIRDAAPVTVAVVPEVPKAGPRPSLFERQGPNEPHGGALIALLTQWLAVAVPLGIVCAFAARRGAASLRPFALWIAFNGVLAASSLALYAAYLGTARLVGGGSVGGALVGACAGSAALLILAVVWRRRLGSTTTTTSEPGAAATLPTVVRGVAYIVAGVMRAGMLLFAFTSALHLSTPDPGREMRDLLRGGLGPVGIALLIFAAVILAPIGEETLFRGVLLPWLRRFLGVDAAVWVSAVLFGIGHIRYGLGVSTVVVYGLVLGWARLQTGNLRASIALHMIINAMVTAVALTRL